jgi:hypothetical protein
MNAVETVETARKGPEIDQNPPFNAVTLAAMREAEAIATGKIRVEWQRSPATKEELKAQIRTK